MTSPENKYLNIQPKLRRPLFFAYVTCIFLSFMFCFIRDLKSEAKYPGDLRNRIVGSRLQADGISPYFFKWNHGHPLRYYDPSNRTADSVSNITASPAFHYLMLPISDLGQRNASILWFFFEYIAWALILFFILHRRPFAVKLIGLGLGLLFLFTDAWKLHVMLGQNYIIIGLLASMLLYFARLQTITSHTGSALTNVLLILIRPLTVIITITALLPFRKMKIFHLITLLVGSAFVIASFTDDFQKNLWKDYALAVKEHTNLHLGFRAAQTRKPPELPIKSIEGFTFRHNIEKKEVVVDSENGNLFVLLRNLANINVTSQTLFFSASLVVLIILGVFYRRREVLTTETIIVLGYVLYILLEIFSPIHRHQYNSVQWLPVILWSITASSRTVTIAGIICGLWLQITHIDLIPMKHTIGELVWMSTVFSIVYTGKR